MKYKYFSILIFCLFLIKIKAQTFEKVEPEIYVLNSCSKQAHISIRYKNEFSGFYQLLDSLSIKWKKNDKILKEGKARGLLATELGTYSCEIKYKNLVIFSNKLELKTFENDVLFSDQFVGPSFGRQSICFQYSFWKNTYTNSIFYYFRAPSVDYNISKVISDSTNASLNWIVDDKLFEKNSNNMTLTTNNSTFKVRLNINEGLCNFFSKEYEVYNEPQVFKPTRSIYEYCEGDTAVILGKFYSSFGKTDKTTWYKDNKIFFEVISDHTNPNEADLITTEPGKYSLKKTFTYKFENGIPIFDENSCVYWQDTITVVFKNNVELKKSNYISNIFPNYQKLDKLFCDSPTVELVTDSLTQNFEWFKNDILIPKERYVLAKSETRWADYVKQKTLYFNQIKLTESGLYYAKIHYTKACIISTDTLNFKGETKFDLLPPNLCTQFNFPLIKRDWEVKSQYESIYTTIWKLDGKEITYNELKNVNSGTFQAILTNKTGCVIESNPLKVEINKINLDLNISDSVQLCPEKQVKLVLKDSSTNIIIFDWVQNGIFLKNKNKELTVNKNGNYQIVFKDNICNNYYSSNAVKVIETPVATASISGSKAIDWSGSADLKIDLTSTPPWQVKLNTGQEFTIDKTPYLLSVKPLTDTKYSIESVKNICGVGTTIGEAIVKVIILADEINLDQKLNLKTFPIPVTNQFEVEIMNSNVKSADLYLYDYTGRIILITEALKNNQNLYKKLNISNLNTGTYILKVKIGKNILERKIIKN